MPWVPPDNGFWAWLVMLGSFLSTGLCLGSINSYGVMYVQLQKNYLSAGIALPSLKASLVGSLTAGISFALSPLAGIVSSQIGIRKTVIFGGIIATFGVAVASFVYQQVELMFLTYGILLGLGIALTHNSCLAILALYFESKLVLVNRIVFTSGSVFTVILPLVLTSVGDIKWALIVLAGCVFLIVLCGLIFETPTGASELLESSSSTGAEGSWSSKKYLTWSLIIPMALFGYYIPYVHLVNYVTIEYPEHKGRTIIMIIGAATCIGRILYSKVADLLQTNRVFFQQVSLLIMGICCITFGVIQQCQWNWIIMISITLGLFDGCFMSQIEPIANELIRIENAFPAKICFFGLSSIAIAAGPSLAGLLYDTTKTYELPFLLAGIPLILSAVILNLVHLVN